MGRGCTKLQGIACAHEHSTRHNIKKLKEQGTIERAEGSERLLLRLRGLFAEIVQFLPELWRQNWKQRVSRSTIYHSTISRHLARLGYSKSLPKTTPMLTEAHKQSRVKLARDHLNDNWKKTFLLKRIDIETLTI